MKRLIALILNFNILVGFSTLDKARSYAEHHSEYPPIGNKNVVLNPDYTLWYQAHAPTLIGRMLSFFKRNEDWSIAQFKRLLVTQLKKREDEGFVHPHVLVSKPAPGFEYSIIGPLFGSFHSLVRILGEFEKQGLITQTFKITRQNVYLIFDGNVIDGSPYILETLSLVLSLMQANPHTVIYIAGQHEHAEYWQSYGLKTELNVRIADFSFDRYVSRFFETLPRSLLLIDPVQEGIIRIGSLPNDLDGLNEASCSDTIKKTAVGSTKVCLLEKAQGELPVESVITGENRLISYASHPGLVQLPSESGVISWSLFSAPNRMYRDYFNFFYDAFAILKIGSSFAQSTLELYHQDVREQAGFKKAAGYAVLSGKAIKPAVQDVSSAFLACEKDVKACAGKKTLVPQEQKLSQKEPLVIGCTLDLSKGASGQGKQVKIGISMCINNQNEKGGIDGRRIDIVFMDDEYSPEKARQNVEEFIKKYKSTLFLCNLGSPTLQAYLDLVRKNDIFIFFPVTGAPLFRKPDLPGVVHWTASYENEAKGLTSYMIDSYGVKDFAFLYQNDSYGMGALEGARKLLAQAKLPKALEVPYERNTTSFKSAIEKIKASPARAIGFFSTAIAATEFIRQAGVEFFIGKKLFALSDLAEETFKSFVHQKGLDMVIAQFSPNPDTSNLEIIKAYRDALRADGRTKVDVFMLGGFISASLMINILNKTPQNFSHTQILQVIEGMKNYHYKGFNLTFNPETRELAHILWLDTGLPEWIEQKTGG